MSKFKKKKGGDLPAVNTASLPDIVFMLLFFFMVATVMRENTLMIEIYAGKPSAQYKNFGNQARIQLNDKFADVSDVRRFVREERASKREELIPFLTTALKVDSDANMGLVSDIKQELRKENALKINYTTRQGDALANQ
jgi:biopolymer transport protein ExbD